LNGERYEGEPTDGRKQRSHGEGKAGARIPPAERKHTESDGSVEHRRPARLVAEREQRGEQHEGETETRDAQRRQRCSDREQREQPRRPEREQRASDDGCQPGEPGWKNLRLECDGLRRQSQLRGPVQPDAYRLLATSGAWSPPRRPDGPAE